MVVYLKKQVVLFPNPMGERVLHYVSHPEHPGPWLALEEACLKIFGVDSPVRISKETIRKAAIKLSSDEGQMIVCDDHAVKKMLVSAGVIGPQTAKFTLVSAAAVETIVQSKGGGTGMLHALKQIDHAEFFDAQFLSSYQGQGSNRELPEPPSTSDTQLQGCNTTSESLPSSCCKSLYTDIDTAETTSSCNEQCEVGSSDKESDSGLLQGVGPLSPVRLQRHFKLAQKARHGPATINTQRHVRPSVEAPSQGFRAATLPAWPAQQHAILGLGSQPQQGALPALRSVQAATHHVTSGGKRPRDARLSFPASSTQRRQRRQVKGSCDGLPFCTDGYINVNDSDEGDDEGQRCHDADDYYDADDDDEEAQLRRAFKSEAKQMRKNTAPPSVRLDTQTQERWSSSQLQSDYGLKELHVSKTLARQLKLLVDKLSSTGIEPLRHNVAVQPLAQATIVKMKKDICRYLGYLRNVKGWDDRYITLSAFSNTSAFSEFIEFLGARTRGAQANKTSDMVTVTLVAIRVNQFLANLLERHADYSLEAVDNSASRAIRYLEGIKSQLCMLKRREAGSNVREKPVLPKASEALLFVERLMDEALKAYKEEASSPGTDSEATEPQTEPFLSLQVCGMIRDAAMMAMLAGHICLTVRISIIRTLKASCFSSTPCTDKGCTLNHCKGNRLEVVEQLSLHTTNVFEAPHYKIVVPHHKTAFRGIMMPPVNIYSKKLTKLLHIWEQYARPEMVRHMGCKHESWKDPHSLFFTHQGMPFNKLNSWYAKLHKTHKAPFQPVPLNKYRSIFVTDRLQNPDTPGPSNEGAAIIMGNSVPTWEASYHNNRRAWLADKAAADAEKYRQACMQMGTEEVGIVEEEEEAEYATAVSGTDDEPY